MVNDCFRCIHWPVALASAGPYSRKDKVMPSSVKEMLAEANAAVPRLNPAAVRDIIGKGDVLIVDVRDAPELASGGKLKGAVNVSRGMLEFRVTRQPLLQSDLSKGPNGHRLLWLGRPCRFERQGPQRARLQLRLQRRRLQGIGRRRARHRASLVAAPAPAVSRRRRSLRSRSSRRGRRGG